MASGPRGRPGSRVSLFDQNSVYIEISSEMTEFLAPLHLIAEQSSIAQAWVEGLDRIREKVSGMTSAQRHTWWLWDKFKSADKDGNGQLEAKEVKKFFKSINLEMNEDNFQQLFVKYDKNKSNRYI